MTRGFIVMFAFALAMVGCEGSSETQSVPPGAAASPASGDVQAALDSYEKIRALLARDETNGVTEEAKKLAASASAAATKASGDPQTFLKAMSASAEALKDKAGEIEAARIAFGELSRHVVALLEADPKLRDGRHLFECPMAKGYEKWVQNKPAIDNPYMGKSMPECGSASGWKP